MQKFTARVVHIAVLAGALLVPCSVQVLADPIPTISIQPLAATVETGSFFDLSVNISPVTDLFAFQFDLSFDPLILSAQSIAEGALLPSGGSTFFIPGTIDNGSGSITFTLDSLFGPGPGVTGTGTLATVSFQALALGTSSVSLSNVVLLDSNLSDIPFTTKGASVSSVPEPGSLLLFCSVLVGLIAFRKSH